MDLPHDYNRRYLSLTGYTKSFNGGKVNPAKSCKKHLWFLGVV